jgi:hypothetical protein
MLGRQQLPGTGFRDIPVDPKAADEVAITRVYLRAVLGRVLPSLHPRAARARSFWDREWSALLEKCPKLLAGFASPAGELTAAYSRAETTCRVLPTLK